MCSHPWEDVVAAHWEKYPCKEAPHVLSSDVVHREIDKEGRLHTTKIIVCKSKLPSILQRLWSAPMFFTETSIVDPKNKTMEVVAMNVTGVRFVVHLEETTKYSPYYGEEIGKRRMVKSAKAAWLHHPQKTLAEQEMCTMVKIPLLWGMKTKTEKMIVDIFHSKSADGQAIMEKCIQRVKMLNFSHKKLKLKERVRIIREDGWKGRGGLRKE